jgi:hypothetical protein
MRVETLGLPAARPTINARSCQRFSRFPGLAAAAFVRWLPRPPGISREPATGARGGAGGLSGRRALLPWGLCWRNCGLNGRSLLSACERLLQGFKFPGQWRRPDRTRQFVEGPSTRRQHFVGTSAGHGSAEQSDLWCSRFVLLFLINTQAPAAASFSKLSAANDGAFERRSAAAINRVDFPEACSLSLRSRSSSSAVHLPLLSCHRALSG